MNTQTTEINTQTVNLRRENANVATAFASDGQIAVGEQPDPDRQEGAQRRKAESDRLPSIALNQSGAVSRTMSIALVTLLLVSMSFAQQSSPAALGDSSAATGGANGAPVHLRSTVPTSSQPNGFKIGMFEFDYMTATDQGCPNVAVHSPSVNGYNSSQLNVLAGDGFNIVQSYIAN